MWYTYKIYKPGQYFCSIDISGRIFSRSNDIQGNLHKITTQDPNDVEKIQLEDFYLIYSETLIDKDSFYLVSFENNVFTPLSEELQNQWNTFILNASNMWKDRKETWQNLKNNYTLSWDEMSLQHRKAVNNIPWFKFNADDWAALGLSSQEYLNEDEISYNKWLPILPYLF